MTKRPEPSTGLPSGQPTMHLSRPVLVSISTLGVVLIAGWIALIFGQISSRNGQPQTQSSTASVASSPTETASSDDKFPPDDRVWERPVSTADEPPLRLKSIGFELGAYDPSTSRAGDLVFTKERLNFKRLWMDYGFTIPGSQSAGRQDKRNPQPTFIVPLGTKVRALVDGVVLDVPKLYSNDYSVMIGTGDPQSPWRYELEHVVNPTVKAGDTVKAGQVVAEAANFGNHAPAGFGVFEIGILKGGNPPQHICPFAYLDPSIKEDTLEKIRSVYTAWEDFVGDPTLYNEATMPVPGCELLDPIDG